MLRAKLSAFPCALVLGAAIGLLAGCAGDKTDPTVNWTPEQIYSEARDAAGSGAYDKAVPLYEKLQNRAAGTPMAQQAELEMAYAQYKDEDKIKAIATLNRFLKYHPASPAADYALYLKGIVNFNGDLGAFSWLTRQDISERDQDAAKLSFDTFKELVTRFPNSRYAPDARARMNYIVNALSQYEVHVARYYYSRGAYLAAANRAQQSVANYPNTPAQEDALHIMVSSYDRLGLSQLRDDTQRVLSSNYPNSDSAASALTVKKGPWWKLW
ncbi:MAG: outer membrane protein assembly factor BamD [Burkholderiaceae bacterium]|jgi:outer membrane protein assembly factor BamD|nr:outer membrane protein assembly factor BamD [Burkholderiaceae bacterium]